MMNMSPTSEHNNLRVCYFGTYEREYPRNALLIDGLRKAGVDVIECHEPVWEKQRDKSGAYRGFAALLMLFHLALAYVRLIVRYTRLPTHDAVIVGYIGQFDMLLAWLLTRLRAVPLIFNPLISLYDTFCNDRGLVRPKSLTGRMFWILDHLTCRVADLVLLDTTCHADYFARTFRLPPAKFRVVPVGADERVFQWRPLRQQTACCNVLFVGKLIPLHGCETILRAAGELRHYPIRFTIIGSGQETAVVQRLINELQLSNVTLIDWVEYDQLPDYYAQADICLGIFGASAKATRVIPNKVFQALAMGRPVITADTLAIRSAFESGQNIFCCPANDSVALANSIISLWQDESLRRQLAAGGHALFQQQYNLSAIAHLLYNVLSELIPGLTPDDRMHWGAQPEFFGPRHRFREDYLVRAVQQHVRGPKLADAACGAGSLAQRLVDQGYEVTAIDLSSHFLRYLQSRNMMNSPALIQADITQLPNGENQFDGIVAGEVLEHLQDDVAALREFHRTLRPGGICVISVPADPNQWDWIDTWAGHVRRYQAGDLRRKLEAQGFEVVSLHSYGFPFVRAFHRYIYSAHVRRTRVYEGTTAQLSARRRSQRVVGQILFGLFHVDRLFDRLPFGMGLIAVARKPLERL
jgi:glycosyltransferase involved in cell wall biosynthesis/2-polyprenyl-3-methyl-5-hydroxy-6-metoxy-1,4-benzoquinol methylase